MAAKHEDFRSLKGPAKAAIMMLALGDDYAAKIFAMLDDRQKGILDRDGGADFA